MNDKEIINIIEATLKEKLMINENIIKYSFYELRIQNNLSEQDSTEAKNIIFSK